LCHNNDLTIDARIQELWPLLYHKAKITNNSISLAFVRGVLAKKKGHKVDWARYAAQAQSMGGKSHKTNIITNSGHTQ
jgi:hypothetical protein